ncbi:zinc finger protein 79-like [Sycon ciliatum]|uniref:zinc finger protein 79-like n=1 Tax=Sycon ciliatum TaxID=27933 RepID=UPI0031F6E2D1
MADCNWTSEGSVASDTFSSLPPLVIWTSKRSVVCPPPQNASYSTPFTAFHNAYAVGGNQVHVATSEASFANFALHHTPSRPWNTPSVISNLRPDQPLLDITDQFRDPRPEFQRNEDTHTFDVSTTAVENPCSNPMISAVEIDQRSQDSGSQTVQYPVSVSDHYAGHWHVPDDSEEGNYARIVSEVDLHIIGHVPESPLAPSVSEYAKNHDRQALAKQHTSKASPEEDSQLLPDFPQHRLSLSKETRVSLERQHDMHNHALSQSGEEPIKCKKCNESFSTQSCLTSHECAHPVEKSFKCKQCDKTFNTRYNLNRHGRVHTGEKPFPCRYCAKSFRDKSNLTVHERRHSGEKPFKCDHCDQGFHDRSNLRVHKRTHTGEKPFKLKLCGKDFRHTSSLADHQRVHTGQKTFKCKACGKTFSVKANLTRHERKHS